MARSSIFASPTGVPATAGVGCRSSMRSASVMPASTRAPGRREQVLHVGKPHDLGHCGHIHVVANTVEHAADELHHIIVLGAVLPVSHERLRQRIRFRRGGPRRHVPARHIDATASPRLRTSSSGVQPQKKTSA